MIKKIQVLLSLFVFVIEIFAQVPSGYYKDVEGKNKAALKTALFMVIKDHTQRTYTNLWTDFQTTDKRADGKVWDMYSSTTNYSFGLPDQDNGTGGSTEGGDGVTVGRYNREHSFPNSWFGGDKSSPMYTDLFHLYPTDKLVNNRRSNYPFGETEGEMYKSNGGFSKLGNCTFSGYTGVVFEPNDEYKGDFARSYFYMATCYEDKIASWTNIDATLLNQTAYPCYKEWTINLLLKWSRQDPVSEKEVNRNNVVYGIQKNRNPFIDNPLFAEYIWGNKMDEIFTATDLENSEFMPVSVYANEGGIQVVCSDKVVVYIYTSYGSLITSQEVDGKSLIPVSSHGVFIVKLLSNKKILTFKVER